MMNQKRKRLPLPFILQYSSFIISSRVAPFAERESIIKGFIPKARVGSNRESDPAYLPIRQRTGPLDKRPSKRDFGKVVYGPPLMCQVQYGFGFYKVPREFGKLIEVPDPPS
jgi:hypothetical protein